MIGEFGSQDVGDSVPCAALPRGRLLYKARLVSTKSRRDQEEYRSPD